jgi:hypothetical protein
MTEYSRVPIEELSKSLIIPTHECLPVLQELEDQLWNSGDHQHFENEVEKLDWMELDFESLQQFSFFRESDNSGMHIAYHGDEEICRGFSHKFLLDVYRYMMKVGIFL